MRFAFTDEQLAFRDAVRDLLAKQCPSDVVRAAWPDDGQKGAGARAPDGRAAVDRVWASLAEMGVLGIAAPPRLGGLGLETLDWVLLAKEAGYAALPWPLVETAAVAVPVLAGADGFGPEMAAAVMAGEVVVVAARLLGAGPVPFARRADAAVVLDESGALVWVASVDAGQRDERAGPAPVKVVDSVDGARGLAPVDARDGRLVTDDPMLIDSAFNLGALGTAAVLVGLARRMLDLTVSHVKERRQFGVPIGSFQAVKHHLADGLRHIELTRPAVARAAWSLATGAAPNPRTCRGSPLIAHSEAFHDKFRLSPPRRSPDGRGLHHRCGPLSRGQAGWRVEPHPPGRPGRPRHQRPRRPHGH